ncbi:MAG: hypothetical protein A4E57_03349 [Syntrophorhabdaceae bacterium PtaU1.Bin034]|nr:MAG: hypothetical protein A4E57_03349 [Syntrophorhabdaceae bacterium PtaU1.Bin034]
MDSTICKIALAGLLHDIGKFAERAGEGFHANPEFLANNADLYQPYNRQQNRYTHKHAVYTAAFIDHVEKLLPAEFNKGQWGLGDSFSNLAAGHHKPSTPPQWIIAMADRISSGFDRNKFEDYTHEINVRDYRKSRLIPVIEGMSLEGEWKDGSITSYKYRYPLKELSPSSIFPVKYSEKDPGNSDNAEREYSSLFFDFVAHLEKLIHKDNVALWLEHFDSLFMSYASHIPAATVGMVIPDISLYDHSKMTAAFACALYRYHTETATFDINSVQKQAARKFLLVSGNFYGIQNFIFSHGGSTGKASAKLLRGRSFYVALLSELAAHIVCEQLGLSPLSVVLNAAGRFTIIAANTPSSLRGLNDADRIINDWLVERFYGEVSIGLSTVQAAPADFVHDRFPALWTELQNATDARKYSKLDLDRYGGVFTGYLDDFDNSLNVPLCPFCGKRPSSARAMIGDENACAICRDHVYIGEYLVKEDRVAITGVDADLKGKSLMAPLFSRYQLSFDVTGSLSTFSRAGSLIKYWDIGLQEEKRTSREITRKFINGYVPKFSEQDNNAEMLDRLLSGRKAEATKSELLDMIKEGAPKSFLQIAKMSLDTVTDGSKITFRGIEAIGILKADIDNLGLLFAAGIKKEMRTLSRFATLSRQLNNYFALYLPSLLQSKPEFKDIYTVFAGGDDLFLIGPWNRIIDLAGFIASSFSDYVCNHTSVTISAGITVAKPGAPVRTIASMAEEALEESKRQPAKGSLTLFGEPVTWASFGQMQKITQILRKWLNSGTINDAALYRLNEVTAMAAQEKKILTPDAHISIEKMDCLKWRSTLKYVIARNVGNKLKSTEKEKKRHMIEEVLKTVEWIDTYGGAFKIPLWQVIYDRR